MKGGDHEGRPYLNPSFFTLFTPQTVVLLSEICHFVTVTNLAFPLTVTWMFIDQ
jgi:hypothetical protein